VITNTQLRESSKQRNCYTKTTMTLSLLIVSRSFSATSIGFASVLKEIGWKVTECLPSNLISSLAASRFAAILFSDVGFADTNQAVELFSKANEIFCRVPRRPYVMYLQLPQGGLDSEICIANGVLPMPSTENVISFLSSVDEFAQVVFATNSLSKSLRSNPTASWVQTSFDISPSLDTVEGCVIGVALGDALGAPIEGLSDEVVASYVADLSIQLDHTRPVKHRTATYPFGQVTDDTQNSRELLIAIIESSLRNSSPSMRPERFAQRLVEYTVKGRMVGMGGTSRHAMQAYQKGNSWETAGSSAPGHSNGSCMRASPIGILCHSNSSMVNRLVEISVLQSHVTHVATSCKAASTALATAVSIALVMEPHAPSNDPFSVEDVRDTIIKRIHETTSKLDPSINYKHSLEAMLQSQTPAQALAVMKQIIPLPPYDEFPTQTRAWSVSSYAPHAVIWAIYSFLLTPFDFWKTMLNCLAGGGDADSTGKLAHIQNVIYASTFIH
jgi:ADP-ribosylglycohydrolase